MATQRLWSALVPGPVFNAGLCSSLVAEGSCRSAAAVLMHMRASQAANPCLQLKVQPITDLDERHQSGKYSSDFAQPAKAQTVQHWQHQLQQPKQQHTAAYSSRVASPQRSSYLYCSSSRSTNSSHLPMYRGMSTSSSGHDIRPPERELPGIAARLHLPPVVVAAAASASCVAKQAAAATAKQVYKVGKLIQQTSFLQAASLQLSSIWQQHSTALTTLTAAAATAGVYQLTYSAAACFVDMTQPGAMYACVAGSAAAVAGLGLYIRAGLVVDPERVYAIAMRKVTHHAGLQEVLGTPMAGSPMRVQLITRGSYFIQENLLLKRRAPRIHMLFPLSGPLKSGVVSLQAKKAAGGKYAFKTLMVELPSKVLKGAAGTAAATSAAVQATAAAERSCSSTTELSAAAAAAVESPDDTARVYIIGRPKPGGSSSSNSSINAAEREAAARPPVPSAQVLLEQLKQPLVFALQQNVVVYEAEDELESELGYDAIPELDPEQITILDRAKQGTCVVVRNGVHWGAVAGCKAVQLVRKSLQAVQQSMTARSKAQQQQQQQEGQQQQQQQQQQQVGTAGTAPAEVATSRTASDSSSTA